ncbi:hypothetical protein HER14_18220 [Acidithiobacillus thiooxidans]|jgi:hypothetical protein|uniref:hypothetical protein n=1 Tax=Acidithiobacillus thiooxidans TaxID=930 RepID=UPI0009D964CB|nr:hypothetical protein [Acidithiobacillus thiooxidans]MBU2752803.1 hypothetical protein [Acidithiobacillus thiooxidans]
MNKPAYHVKNLKIFRGMEGQGFNATLYLGKQRLGTVIDDASGGPVVLELSPADRSALDEYVQSLPDITCTFNDPDTGKPATLKPSADWFVSNLVNRTDRLKQIKKILKKPTMLVVLKNGEIFKIEYTREVDAKTLTDYQKTYPDHFVFNGLTDDQIIDALESHGL